MIDRPGGGERVVLVHVNFPAGNLEEDLQEFAQLALSAGAEISATITGNRRAPESKYFVGTGKAEEIHQAVIAAHAQLVIFNHVLTPAQERNLERLTQCRVIDRTGLILDIFAQRARSFEGKLQVELALLRHLSTRLIRGWTHLERQRGGIGLRGPGETQLEVDRRLIRGRIKHILQRLKKIRQQRIQGRKARRKATVPTIALVGYTNAGKSTLFNVLTQSDVYVANQLFATLDPTLRRLSPPETGPIILADTVGFIKHLPHELIKAFQATLEEVKEADVLVHVVDAADTQKALHIEEVNQVLESLEATHAPILLVYNKIDLVDDYPVTTIERNLDGKPTRVYISAVKGIGLHDLITALSELLDKNIVETTVSLTPMDSKIRAQLYEADAVMGETIDSLGNYQLIVRLPKTTLESILKRQHS